MLKQGQYYHLCLPHIDGRDMQPLAENQSATDFSHHSFIQSVGLVHGVNKNIAKSESTIRRVFADNFGYIACRFRTKVMSFSCPKNRGNSSE